MYRLGLLVVIMTSAAFLFLTGAHASAGWYPIAKGEVIEVEYCLPTAKVGTLVLQAVGVGNKVKSVAVVMPSQLKKDSYCADDMKYGFGEGLYHFKYKWRVNISGEWGLQLHSPRLKRTFYGWPDGITTRAK